MAPLAQLPKHLVSNAKDQTIGVRFLEAPTLHQMDRLYAVRAGKPHTSSWSHTLRNCVEVRWLLRGVEPTALVYSASSFGGFNSFDKTTQKQRSLVQYLIVQGDLLRV